MRNKKARWIRHTHIFGKDEYECASCGYSAEKPYKTCPNCGCLMQGAKYDPSWVDEMEGIDAFADFSDGLRKVYVEL